MGGFHILSGGGGSQMPSIKMAGFAPCSRQTGLVRIAVLCLCLLFIVATPAWPQGTFATIDVPGAGTGVLQGTIGFSINANGDIAGIYLVAGNVAHGFVRTADGTITKFDAPSAGTGGHRGTEPISINAAGDITGIYTGNSPLRHGF